MSAFFLGADQLLVSTRLGRNQLIDLPSGRAHEVAPPGSRWTVSPTGPHHLAYQSDGRGLVADLRTGTTVPLQRGPAAVKALIFTPDGEQAVAASTDGLLGRWRTDDGQPIRRHQVGEPISAWRSHPTSAWSR